ncbi:hypothetical protein K1719_047566 [Acacia pycnantha]|nr:hypothetical protein K1719_047566 [Acacia pycnantha]
MKKRESRRIYDGEEESGHGGGVISSTKERQQWCTLIRTQRPHAKEVVQTTKLDQCTLLTCPQEQYTTIEISPDLIDLWKSQGYTHLHFSVIRLILTFHGRKGLLVTAKVALLNSTFKSYSNALIGSLLTTLSNDNMVEDSDDEQGMYPCKYALKQEHKNKSFGRSPCRSHTSKRFDDNDDYGSSQPISTRHFTRRWQPPPPPKRLSKDMSLVELTIETGHLDLVQKYSLDVVPSSPLEPFVQPPVAA